MTESPPTPQKTPQQSGRKWYPLKKRADFLAVRNAGVSIAVGGVVMQVKPHNLPKNSDIKHDGKGYGDKGHDETGGDIGTSKNDSAPLPLRVGFTATKKIGNAVVRNRAKRRLRALTDSIIAPHGDKNHDYVLIARGGTATRPWQKLQNDVKLALQKLNLYTG